MTELFFLFSTSEYLLFSCRRQLYSWTEHVLSMLTFLLFFFFQCIHIHRKENVFLALNVMVLLIHVYTYSLEFSYLWSGGLAFIRPQKSKQSYQVHLGLLFTVSYLHITLRTCSVFFISGIHLIF